MPLTHEVDIKIPAVSGSSGRLVVERLPSEEEERYWPGRVFENSELTYEEAMLDFAAASSTFFHQNTLKSPRWAKSAP